MKLCQSEVWTRTCVGRVQKSPKERPWLELRRVEQDDHRTNLSHLTDLINTSSFSAPPAAAIASMTTTCVHKWCQPITLVPKTPFQVIENDVKLFKTFIFRSASPTMIDGEIQETPWIIRSISSHLGETEFSFK